jgi:hypothetical protein
MPFIIFGIKRKGYLLIRIFAVCGLCQTPAAQTVTRIRTFFSLFFVPLIPISSRYITTCTMCGRATKITKEDADRYVASAQAQPTAPLGSQPVAPPPPPLSLPPTTNAPGPA